MTALNFTASTRAARSMRRFYRLDVEPDLFGGVLLVKEWGRIGARGRVVAQHFDSAALAATALKRQASRKSCKGSAIVRASR